MIPDVGAPWGTLVSDRSGDEAVLDGWNHLPLSRLPNPDFGSISFEKGYPEAVEPTWLGFLGNEHSCGEDTLK